MSTRDPDTMRERERAEIERSESEAAHLKAAPVKSSEQNNARYMNPPADTCFPLEYCFHLLGDVREKTVLDFGCGDGENTLTLALRRARVVSMDISTALITRAKQRLAANGVSAPVTFVAGSGHAVPLRDESVDVVLGIAILHHLDLPLAAREVKRVLRPGGHAIFLEPIRNSPTLRRLRPLIPYRSPDVSPFERPLTDPELEAFGEGFRHFETRAFALPYIGVVMALPVLPGLVSRLFRVDRRLLDLFPSLWFWATVKVVRLVK
jgi:SAM-dependent methyltransferase